MDVAIFMTMTIHVHSDNTFRSDVTTHPHRLIWDISMPYMMTKAMLSTPQSSISTELSTSCFTTQSNRRWYVHCLQERES